MLLQLLNKDSLAGKRERLLVPWLYGLFSNLRLHPPQQFDGNYEECKLKSTAGSANPQLFSDQLNTFVL